MYENLPNEGMRCLKELVAKDEYNLDWKVFDARYAGEIPTKDYDIFISTGGPGSPYEGEGKPWRKDFFKLLDQLWAHNQNGNPHKKYFFGICYSFQLASIHFDLGNVCERKSTSFGVFPIHKTENSRTDQLFKYLPDPFYGVDSRDWQLIEPDAGSMGENETTILAIEKKREHIPLPRAIMSVRIGDEMYFTQFHPEADAQGMLRYLANPKKRKAILQNHDEWKIDEMLRFLKDDDKIPLTQMSILPPFLKTSIEKLSVI